MRQIPSATKTFLNPEELLKTVPVSPRMVVADFGSGNGYYAVAAALLAGKKGQVYAVDVMEEALSQTATLAKLTGVHNVSTKLCDLEKFGSCPIADTSCDLVILSSLLHQVQDKQNVMREAYRVLKSGGKILVIEWNATSVFGPPLGSRIGQEEAKNLLAGHGFRPSSELPAGSFHYALLYQK